MLAFLDKIDLYFAQNAPEIYFYLIVVIVFAYLIGWGRGYDKAKGDLNNYKLLAEWTRAILGDKEKNVDKVRSLKKLWRVK